MDGAWENVSVALLLFTPRQLFVIIVTAVAVGAGALQPGKGACYVMLNVLVVLL